MTDQISNLIQAPHARFRQDIVSMHAYAIQDSVGMVKLDAMENPHRLPADLQQKLGERLIATRMDALTICGLLWRVMPTCL
jgi:histidinol-phosphate aminotransferase